MNGSILMGVPGTGTMVRMRTTEVKYTTIEPVLDFQFPGAGRDRICDVIIITVKSIPYRIINIRIV